MNVAALSARVHAHGGGFRPSDFSGDRLEAGYIIVSPVRPPELSVAGVIIPEQARKLPGQFAIMHKVEVVSSKQSGDLLQVQVGDIVKVHNAHLDPLDPGGELLAIPTKHVLAVLVPAESEFTPSPPRLATISLIRPASDLDLDDEDVTEVDGEVAA